MTRSEASEAPRAVWITRAEPGASATAARVRALGLEAVVAPLLQVRRLADAAIDLTGAAALVFTSPNAPAAFAEQSHERGLPVFAVGDATAAAARRAGFTGVVSAQGDVRALAALLAARKAELDGVLVYLAAARPSQDLAALLAPVGLQVRQVPLYETVTVAPDEALIARLASIDGVLVHSARAAQALAQVLERCPAPHLVAYCLSAQVAEGLGEARLAARNVAQAPDEASLLSLIARPKPL